MNERIRREYEEYRRMTKAALRAEYSRRHRVSDSSGLSKGELITDILVAQYGQKRVSAAFA
jgi:hypothetical protein